MTSDNDEHEVVMFYDGTWDVDASLMIVSEQERKNIEFDNKKPIDVEAIIKIDSKKAMKVLRTILETNRYPELRRTLF